MASSLGRFGPLAANAVAGSTRALSSAGCCPPATVTLYRMLPDRMQRALPVKQRDLAVSPTWPRAARFMTTSKGDTTSLEAAGKNLVKTIQSEIQHEQSTYEQDADLKKFLQTSGWKLTENDNDMMVTLQREVGSKKVVVEFSCVQNADAPTEEGPAPEMSDFTVTVTEPDDSGVTFYCSTTQDEEDKFRYCIGQVRFFKSAQEKESLSVYPGPYFEDLDDAFQQGLDEWLGKLGVDPQLCDFIDRFSVDKENREYLGWLHKLAQFVSK